MRVKDKLKQIKESSRRDFRLSFFFSNQEERDRAYDELADDNKANFMKGDVFWGKYSGDTPTESDYTSLIYFTADDYLRNTKINTFEEADKLAQMMCKNLGCFEYDVEDNGYFGANESKMTELKRQKDKLMFSEGPVDVYAQYDHWGNHKYVVMKNGFFVKDFDSYGGVKDMGFEDAKNFALKIAESKIRESNLIYKYRLKLVQGHTPCRITNLNTLKFKTEQEAQDKLNSPAIQSLQQKLQDKYGAHLEVEEIQSKERKSRPKASDDPNFKNPFKVGDILEGDFGYSMILPVWYEVYKVTATRVYCKKLKSHLVDHDGYGQAGHKMPNLGDYDSKYPDDFDVVMTVKKYGTSGDPKRDYSAYLRRGSTYAFHLWDGKPAEYDSYD